MLYLYALALSPTTLPATHGIRAAPIDAESVDGVDAIVSVLAVAAVDVSEDAILDHARVVEALHGENEAVLPARFGLGYDDRGSLRRGIEARVPEFRAALEAVRGCVELGLRVEDPDVVGRGGEWASGREYMLGRLDEERRVQQLADELHAPLARLARKTTRSVGATPRLLMSGAYLVPRVDLDAFRTTLETLEQGHPRLTFACTGPWPPYSFTADAQAP
jgi:Gas vesicle synthesis protein GvpL/GvpF